MRYKKAWKIIKISVNNIATVLLGAARPSGLVGGHPSCHPTTAATTLVSRYKVAVASKRVRVLLWLLLFCAVAVSVLHFVVALHVVVVAFVVVVVVVAHLCMYSPRATQINEEKLRGKSPTKQRPKSKC